MASVNVGDRVEYYCFTNCVRKVGTVEQVDVAVTWRGPGLGIIVDGVAKYHPERCPSWRRYTDSYDPTG